MSAVALKHCEKYPMHIYRGVDLISDVLPFARLWYGEPNTASNAVDYAKFYSRSHDAVIRVYDAAGDVIETHEQAGEFEVCKDCLPAHRCELAAASRHELS